MKIELNLPSGEKQQQFVDQLNAAVREISSGSSGSAGFDADGLFRSTIEGVLRLKCGDAALSWALVWSTAGTLTAIEVEPTEVNDVPAAWAEDVSGIVASSLAAALSDRRQRFFHRMVFNYVGPALDGEYWFSGFRLAPLMPNDEHPALINAERILTIDMNVEAADRMHASAVGDERGRRYAARVCLLSDLPLYRARHEHRWVLRINASGHLTSSRLQLGFSQEGLGLGVMPRKGEVCELGKYSGSWDWRHRATEAGGRISLPHGSRTVLGALTKASPVTVDAFDRCSRLYQTGLVCGRIYPSVGLAYRVAAVQAIVETTGEFASFSEFVRAHVPDRADLDAVLDYLYSRVRSAHFHAGEFPSGEFSRPSYFDPFMDPAEISRFDWQWRGSEIIREAIVSWVFKVLPVVQNRSAAENDDTGDD